MQDSTTAVDWRTPPGPTEKYDTTLDLLRWMDDQFKRFGNTFKASINGTSAYLTRDPHIAQHVLRDNWHNYVKGRAIKRIGILLGNGLMVSEGEFWKAQRRMIQPAFHHKAIAGLTEIMATSNIALLRQWEHAAIKRAGVNVTLDVSGVSLEVVLISIFGADYQAVAPHFKILSEKWARNLEFAQMFRSLGKVILKIIAIRRKEKMGSNDLLGMLMEARDQKSGRAMLDQQLVNEIRTLIVAGHETTASTLNWIWYLLSQNPDVEEKLSSELNLRFDSEIPHLNDLAKFSYMRHVIEEALRLYPAGWLLTRKALKDDKLGDYFVPAGTEIYISPYFIQRHPDIWQDPDRFNPDRFGSSQFHDRHLLAILPFSIGPRNCIGELFARTEMQIHLMTITKRLRFRFVAEKPPVLEAAVNLRSEHDFIMYPELKTSTR